MTSRNMMEQMRELERSHEREARRGAGWGLNVNLLTHDSLELFGNGMIGQIANAQAGLNHSGLLGMDTLFSVSDVVDAVNYKSGDVKPVLEGLLNRYCDALDNGECLADSAAVMRVWVQLQNYRTQRERERIRKRGDGSPELRWPTQPTYEQATCSVEWIDRMGSGMRLAEAELWKRLLMRRLRANGPWTALVEPVKFSAAYRAVKLWVDWRRDVWSEFFRQIGERLQLSDDVYRERTRELQSQVEQRFVESWSDWLEGWSASGESYETMLGSWTAAYVQFEALRRFEQERQQRQEGVRRALSEEPRPLDLRPVLAICREALPDEFDESGHTGTRGDSIALREISAWLNGQPSPETVLAQVRKVNRAAALPLSPGRVYYWNEKARTLEYSGGTPLRVISDPQELTSAGASGETGWQFCGFVGGDSDVAVLLPEETP